MVTIIIIAPYLVSMMTTTKMMMLNDIEVYDTMMGVGGFALMMIGAVAAAAGPPRRLNNICRRCNERRCRIIALIWLFVIWAK